MSIDIRESIRNNFKNSSREEMIESIESSITDKEEITLPGLGVFFEILWENSNDEFKDNIINIIQNNIEKKL